MTSPVRRRNPPHRAVSAPVSSDLLTRKLLASTPPSGPLLLTYASLPPWSRDNAYILTAYRPTPCNSLAKCLQSLLFTHNESVNIHSHLLGCFLFLFIGLALYAVEGRAEEVKGSDVLVFAAFFAGAVGCLGASAWFHCVQCHSETWAVRAQRGDYVGIVGLIWGSFVPSVWYGFLCDRAGERGRRWGYLVMISIIGLGCTVVSVTPKFRTPQWRPFRAGMFVAMGLSAVVPVLHGLKLYGLQEMKDRMALPWVILQGFLYILGAGLYAVSAIELSLR